MKLSITLVNIFLSPIAVGIARQRARVRKHKDFFYKDIAIYCAEDQMQFIKDAVDALIAFHDADWPRYQKNLKWILLDNELQTILWVPRRTTIIQESDDSRMRSATHFVAGLVADCERIQTYRENRCTTILWKKGIPALARQRGEAKRKEYLSLHQDSMSSCETEAKV